MSVELTARFLEAAGKRVWFNKERDAWVYATGLAEGRYVPDYTLPEHLGTVVGIVREAGYPVSLHIGDDGATARVWPGGFFNDQSPCEAVMTAFIRAKGLEVPE